MSNAVQKAMKVQKKRGVVALEITVSIPERTYQFMKKNKSSMISSGKTFNFLFIGILQADKSRL